MKTTLSKELAPIAQRLENAERGFIETLVTLGGITEDEAKLALATFRKAKVTKLDLGIGRMTVKHGAFLDRDVIRRAAGILPFNR